MRTARVVMPRMIAKPTQNSVREILPCTLKSKRPLLLRKNDGSMAGDAMAVPPHFLRFSSLARARRSSLTRALARKRERLTS